MSLETCSQKRKLSEEKGMNQKALSSFGKRQEGEFTLREYKRIIKEKMDKKFSVLATEGMGIIMVAQIFTIANNFDTVTLKQGETFLIKLRDQPAEHLYSKEKNHSAKTVWEMKAEDGLKLLRESFTPEVPDTETLPGIHEWEYEATKPGTWEIEGKYSIFRFGGEDKFKLTVKII
jgi:predicted secreted protein